MVLPCPSSDGLLHCLSREAGALKVFQREQDIYKQAEKKASGPSISRHQLQCMGACVMHDGDVTTQLKTERYAPKPL